MTFSWGFPIAGPDDYQNTEIVLRDGFLPELLRSLTDFHHVRY
jgi:hypothetical protein